MTNKKDFQTGVMTDLFSPTSKKDFASPVIEDTKKEVEQRVETKPRVEKEVIESIITKKRSYNLPTDILEDIDKVVYMNRDIKDNTDLLIRALRKYLSSKENKELIEEYNTIKGQK